MTRNADVVDKLNDKGGK